MTFSDIPITGDQEELDQDTSAEPTGDDGDQGGGSLEERIRQLEQENQQLKEQRLRAVADLENVRRRAREESLATMRYANEELLKAILPTLDDLERSIESGATTKDYDKFYEGVSMIRNKLMKTLDDQGVKKIEAVGQPFDVELHEALMRQPSDQEEDTVIAELEPGYLYRDKVLRHAKVIVSA